MSLSLCSSFSDVVQYFGSHISAVASQLGDFCLGRGEYRENFNFIVSKAMDIAKKIFIVIASVALTMANPIIFTLSFVVGFAFDDRVREVLQRIWQRIGVQPWPLALAAGCAAFVSLPISLALLSSAWALHLGSSLSYESGLRVEEIDSIV